MILNYMFEEVTKISLYVTNIILNIYLLSSKIHHKVHKL